MKFIKDKVNADSDLRNKQTDHGNDRDGSKDVATVSTSTELLLLLLLLLRQSYLLMR